MTPGAPAVARAGAAERERLLGDFVVLCEIESPSGRERGVADWVTRELRDVGLEVQEDQSAAETGSEAGNLLARIDGPEGAPTVLLCAHLDTVPLDGPVEVVREADAFHNRHEAILGADNKAAVALLLALARRYVEQPPPVGLELLFTTCEERALAGIKALEGSVLRSSFGFVFDHASAIGELIVAAPTYHRIEVRLHGQAAHAGIRPEDGRNAIEAAASAVARLELGRIDEGTTANVGLIAGGSAPNVVAEHCRVVLEVRSLDDARAGEVVTGVVDTFTEAASDGECDLEVDVQEQFRAYRLPRSSSPVLVASAALEALGIEPRLVATGGGSDANVLMVRGLPCLNVANGTERNHQPDERVSIGSLETMLDLGLEMVARCA